MGTWFVKPFELFEVGGAWFVYRVKSRLHQRVGEADVALLARVCVHGNAALGTEDAEVLARYQLLAQEPWDDVGETEKLVSLIRGSRKNLSPLELELFVSQTCNMRCTYCYGGDGSYHETGLMDLKTAKSGLDWFRARFCATQKPEVVFFGGEPAMNFSLVRACVAYARELFAHEGVSFGMATNMTLMTDERLDFVASVPDFKLLVSIDGPRSIHNRQRPLRDGGDSHALTAERIRAALARGIPCTGRATVYADTDRRAVEREMRRLGLSRFQLTVVSGCAADGVRRNDGALVYERWLNTWPHAAVRLVRAVRARNRSEVDTLLEDEDLRMLFAEGASGRRAPSAVMGCAAGRGQYALSASGELYPCHRFVGMREFCLGTLPDGLHEGWPEFAEERLAVREECRACFVRYGCGGACYYQCYADGNEGSIFGMPEHYCEYMRMRTRLAVYFFHALTADEKRWALAR